MCCCISHVALTSKKFQIINRRVNIDRPSEFADATDPSFAFTVIVGCLFWRDKERLFFVLFSGDN